MSFMLDLLLHMPHVVTQRHSIQHNEIQILADSNTSLNGVNSAQPFDGWSMGHLTIPTVCTLLLM